MKKTTVYLPEDVKSALERRAAATGRSEAELIRESIQRHLADSEAPAPVLPRFSSGDARFADRTDELLEGFGSR